MSYFPNGNFLLEVAKGNISGHSIISKFGSNTGVPNGSWEMITSLSVAPYAGFLQAATTVRIKAGGNAADAAAGAGARSIIVEGVDSSLVRVSEEITTAGASASSATTASFWRIDRAYVGDAGTYGGQNTGNVTIETSGGTADLIRILAGNGQSQHCCVAIPDATTAYLLGYEITVDASKACDLRLYRRNGFNDVSAPFVPVRIQKYWDGVAGTVTRDLLLPEKIATGPADVWVEARGGSVSEVSATLNLLLVAD